jgi:putative ABC transport system permease protein
MWSRTSATVRIGLRGLLLFKTRSLLSTLGIVFGVGAVVSMMSIGEGAKRQALEHIKLLGTNNVRIKDHPLTGDLGIDAERRASRGLTFEDGTLIQDTLPALVEVAPMKIVSAQVHVDGRQVVAQVVGVGEEFQRVTSAATADGRFITSFDVADTKNVCVLGDDIKQALFGPRDALGAAVRIGDIWFTVAGVMEAKATPDGPPVAMGLRRTGADIYIPITTALKRFPTGTEMRRVDEIAVRVGQAEDVGPVARVIHGLLKQAHRGVEDYDVVVPEELLAQAQATQKIFNIIMGSIAGISLVVGGIGIMNIMLANVSERTREIGIRRAIGATRQDILGQFLVETVLVCLAGGTAGVLAGFGLAHAITFYAGWPTAFTVVSIVAAFGTSVCVGLVFGLLPARRAALLHPVQALRAD